MKIVQASFLWKNDQPNGVGFCFGAPIYTPDELTAMFDGEHARRFMRDSDSALGDGQVVRDYLGQLGDVAACASKAPPTFQQAILASLNIMWLSSRGFITNDEFNGVHFIRTS